MNWPDLVSMGGYEFYVWTSYALTLMAMAGEVLVLLWRRREWREATNVTAFGVSKQVRT
jgi:heme exporter protein D